MKQEEINEQRKRVQEQLEFLRDQLDVAKEVEGSGFGQKKIADMFRDMGLYFMDMMQSFFEMGVHVGAMDVEQSLYRSRKADASTMRVYKIHPGEFAQVCDDPYLGLSLRWLHRLVFVERPSAHSAVALFQKYNEQQGMFENYPYTLFLEHSRGMKFPVLTPDGQSFYRINSVSACGDIFEPDTLLRLSLVEGAPKIQNISIIPPEKPDSK
jgi:hypothetical protein